VDVRNNFHQDHKQVRHVLKNQDSFTFQKNIHDTDYSAESPDMKMEYQYKVRDLIA
jgi:hypothetical protein